MATRSAECGSNPGVPCLSRMDGLAECEEHGRSDEYPTVEGGPGSAILSLVDCPVDLHRKGKRRSKQK